jgi:hypothetical protein
MIPDPDEILVELRDRLPVLVLLSILAGVWLVAAMIALAVVWP